MADKKIVFIYPLNKIQKMFPRLNPSMPMSKEECGIEKGWHPHMESYCGYAYETEYFYSSCYGIHGFLFDEQFTKEIFPYELYKSGYRLIEQHFKPMDKSGEVNEDAIRYTLMRKTPENLKQSMNVLSRIIKQKAGDYHIQDRKKL